MSTHVRCFRCEDMVRKATFPQHFDRYSPALPAPDAEAVDA